MSTKRFDAIEHTLQRPIIDVKLPSNKISDFFAENVFSIDTMRKYLSKDAFIGMMAVIESGKKIDSELADQVASAMKEWAMEKGATSYTHWFQPLTGATAEKHDTFFTPTDSSKGIEKFKGKELVQQEPDGSSFPTGGLRATFEARGYTAWDPSSPAFIVEVGTSAKTLCIPTIFVAYTGEALDFKVPLLKSQQLLQRAAVPVCNYFDEKVQKVVPTLGWEQEYFLVDAALFAARPDLLLTGRTVLGAAPPKGQQLDDHYFGSISERVHAYMLDFETEALKLGITISTRHNEVAPGQYECAPVFSDVNSAVDKNQLVMDIMDRVARRHGLRLLLHEKPFAGVNGSGKHNNWSLATDTGINLLAPGDSPETNLQFLTFFVNTIKAVHTHANLLRAAIASAGNDHRLGANEAPPAIISIFIGSTLTKVLESIAENSSTAGKATKEKLNIVGSIPDLFLDNTDRNRTSPFAFTGNKFEFRAVGSSANCAAAMTALNTIVADQLFSFKKEVDVLIKKGRTTQGALLKVLSSYIKEAKAILFEGDNYTDEWATEAARRGLSNVKDTPRALGFYVTPKAKSLLVGNGIYKEAELAAFYEVLLENYELKIDIESKVMEEMVINQILPVAIEYQSSLANNILTLKDLGYKKKQYKAQTELLESLGKHINAVKAGVDKMVAARKKAHQKKSAKATAIAYGDKVKGCFDEIRTHADALEQLIDDQLWPLPKYRELLFIK